MRYTETILVVFMALLAMTGTARADRTLQCLHPQATGGPQGYPRIAAARDNVVVVWQDYGDLQWDVIMAYSRDGGGQFSAPLAVNTDATGTDQMYPDVAMAANGDAYIVWQDRRNAEDGLPGDFDIYFALLVNSATDITLNRDLNAADTAGSQVRPRIMVSPAGMPVIAWEDNRLSTSEDSSTRWEIRATWSEDQGASFAPVATVSDDAMFFQTDAAALAGDGVLNFAWFNWGSGLQTRTYTLADQSFGDVAAADASFSGEMLKPSMAATGAGRWIVWQDSRDYEISKRDDLVTNSGRYWDIYGAFQPADAGQPAVITRINIEPSLSQFMPALCGNGDAAVACWSDNRSLAAYRIYCARLSDDGQAPAFELELAPPGVDEPPLDQLFPSCAVDGDTLHVVWQQEMPAGDMDVYYTSATLTDLAAPEGR